MKERKRKYLYDWYRVVLKNICKILLARKEDLYKKENLSSKTRLPNLCNINSVKCGLAMSNISQ